MHHFHMFGLMVFIVIGMGVLVILADIAHPAQQQRSNGSGVVALALAIILFCVLLSGCGD